jgi:hypothetical protein
MKNIKIPKTNNTKLRKRDREFEREAFLELRERDTFPIVFIMRNLSNKLNG